MTGLLGTGLEVTVTAKVVREVVSNCNISRGKTSRVNFCECFAHGRDQAGLPLRAVEMAFPMCRAEAPAGRKDHVYRAAQMYTVVLPGTQARSVFPTGSVAPNAPRSRTLLFAPHRSKV